MKGSTRLQSHFMNKITGYNTDNKGHLFVTVFANRSCVPRHLRNHDKADGSFAFTEPLLPGLITKLKKLLPRHSTNP